MMNGISSSSAYFGQMQSTRQGSGSEGRFNKLDTDGNGGIDLEELQTLTDKISDKTGMEIDIAEVSATYDANNDGLLGQDEMNSMMMEIREKMGSPQSGAGQSQKGLEAYLNAEEDSATTLMDILSEQAKNKAAYTPFSLEV